MTQPEPRTRRRGVRASRIKLLRALTEAGLKTQAALAERIADREGLDAPPKDIVNRVFREQPVDAVTLERVARALGVEAWQLYKTASAPEIEPLADEPGGAAGPATAEPGAAEAGDAESTAEEGGASETSPTIASTTPVSQPPARRGGAVLLAVTVVVLAVGGWLWHRPTESAAPLAAANAPAPLKPRFGRFKVAILQFKGDPDGQLAVLLHERLEKTLGVTSAALPLIAMNEDRGELAQRFRVDAVLDGEVVRVGQLQALRLFAFVEARGRRQQIWAEHFPVSQPERLPAVADRATAAVHRLFGMPEGDSRNPPHFPLAPVQDEYLQGRLYLDKAPSEINLRRAANHFEAALRHDSNYAVAHAGLCEVSLDAVWINEERQLANAEKSCVRAMQLAPQSPEVVRANAYFLYKSGRGEEAVQALRQLNDSDPGDAETLLALASAEFAVYRLTGAAEDGARAIARAREAAAAAPGFWKPWMWLGIYEAGAGTTAAAIAALETANAYDPANEYVVTNLGTMYLCRGDFEKARDLYLQARDVAPGSYAGTEFLGTIYYYLRDFDESARLRQLALDMARAAGGAEIHQMWGALGDSYRQAGKHTEAVNAYVRALEIVERDFLTGTAGVADKAARAYYYLALLELDPGKQPKAAIASLERDLEEALSANAESSSLLRIAQAWLIKGETDRARAALDKATQRCRCYAEFPDVAPLKVTAKPKRS